MTAQEHEEGRPGSNQDGPETSTPTAPMVATCGNCQRVYEPDTSLGVCPPCRHASLAGRAAAALEIIGLREALPHHSLILDVAASAALGRQ